jgi:hypothetical protein
MIFDLERFLNHVSFARSTPTPKVLIPLIPLVLNSRMPCPGQDSCSPPLGTNRWQNFERTTLLSALRVRVRHNTDSHLMGVSDTRSIPCRVKDCATMPGLALASVCSTLRCVHVNAYTPLAREASMGSTRGIFHAQVCARQCLHTFNLVARQRLRHDARACPRERVFHARVCARQCLHTSVVVAHHRRRHDGACPCERVFHAQVCARQRLHTSVLVAN